MAALAAQLADGMRQLGRDQPTYGQLDGGG
jgi:hypothetical protein